MAFALRFSSLPRECLPLHTSDEWLLKHESFISVSGGSGVGSERQRAPRHAPGDTHAAGPSAPLLDRGKKPRGTEASPQISHPISGLSAQEALFLLSQHVLNYNGPLLKEKNPVLMVSRMCLTLYSL